MHFVVFSTGVRLRINVKKSKLIRIEDRNDEKALARVLGGNSFAYQIFRTIP